MQKKRVFKAFVAAGFRNAGRAYGFTTQGERDEFVEAIEGARPKAFVDLTPRQYREWKQDGSWSPYLADDGSEYIPDGRLLRPGIDNDWPLERRDGKPEIRWGFAPDPYADKED